MFTEQMNLVHDLTEKSLCLTPFEKYILLVKWLKLQVYIGKIINRRPDGH